MLTSAGALASSASAAYIAPAPASIDGLVPATSTQRTGAPIATPAAVTGRVMVSFAPGTSAEARESAVRAVGGHIDDEIPSLGLFRVAVPADGSDGYGAPAIAEALMAQPGVVSAEPDEVVSLEFAPNDEFYTRDPYVGLGQWGLRKAGVDLAWDRTRASNITVAVIDSGVDPGHPDLQGALLPGRTYLAAPRPACSATATRDDNSHGTHVTGIIAADAGNGIGVAGVAFGAKVLPLKTLDCEGHGMLSDVAKAIADAIDSGARIINISLGSNSDSSTLRSAIALAESRNVLVVAAAGNCGGVPLDSRCDVLNQRSYPAAYSTVLAVGATEPDDTRSSFSTQADYVDIAAPGRRIVSTAPTYGTTVGTLRYAAFSGTSQATPFVSGVAALIWSKEPSLTVSQVRARLISTVQDLGMPGRDDGFGAGRVNALAAVTAAAPVQSAYGAAYGLGAVPKAVAAGATVATSVMLTNTSSFAWPATGTGAVRLAYSWIDAAGATVSTGPVTALPASVQPGATVQVPVQLIAPSRAGQLTLRFDLIHDGVGAFSGKGVRTGDVLVTVGSGSYGAAYQTFVPVSAATVGVPATVQLKVTNTGTLTWPASGPTPVRLSYHLLDTSGRMLVWDGTRTALPRDIKPGETIDLALGYASPPAPGAYTLRVDLVHEGIGWFSGKGVPAHSVAVNVRTGYAASYAVSTPPIVLPGSRVLVPVTVRNEGTLAWEVAGPNPVRLAAHIADTAGNTVLWDGARTAFNAPVAPGASVTTHVILDVPRSAGSYRVRVDLVREGIAWFSGSGSATGDSFVTAADDLRGTLPTGPVTVSRAAPSVSVTLRNGSTAVWTTGGAVSVALASHWLDAQGRVLLWDGPRTALPKSLAPGESITMAVRLAAVPAGATQIVIDVVADGLRWGGIGGPRAVTLVP